MIIAGILIGCWALSVCGERECMSKIKSIIIVSGLYVGFVCWVFLAMYGAVRIVEKLGLIG